MDFWECVAVGTATLSLSIVVTVACFAQEHCKVNVLRHLVTFTENLQNH